MGISSIFQWLSDVSRFPGVMRRRKRLLRGAGADYTGEGVDLAALVAAIHPQRMHLEVVEARFDTPRAKRFRFRRTDGAMPPFRAGQYLTLFAQIDGIHTGRPYSIASAPGEETLELVVQENPGG